MRVHPNITLTRLLALAAALGAVSVIAAGCGIDENERSVKEGEAVELGDLRYNVQITRFLNPDDPEDVAYLQGEPDPAPGKAYLGVFMTIENAGDDAQDVPGDFRVVDTRDETYEPKPNDSPYALKPGTSIPPDEQIPAPGTPAAAGPIQGAMLLFEVDQGVTENRPLELEIPSASGDGRVQLDI